MNRILPILVLAMLAAVPIHAQTEVESGVPVLSDLPLLGNLFRQHHATRWFPLDVPDDVRPTALTPQEAWILELVRRNHPELSEVAVVDRTIVRHDGTSTLARRERGIEIRGQKAALDAARPFLEKISVVNRKIIRAEVTILDLGSTEGSEPGENIEVAAVDAAALTARTSEKPRRVLHRSTLSVYNAQQATVSLVRQVSFVKDFDVEISQATVDGKPIIDVVDEGIVLDVQPIIDPATHQLRLRATARSDVIVRPIREFTTSMGGGKTLTFQVPEVNTTRWDSKEVALRSGEQGIRIGGLLWRDPEAGDDAPLRRLEIWCVLDVDTLAEEGAGHGTVLNMDTKNRKLFVNFPETAVPDPVDEAPEVVGVWRDGKRVATAKHEGGWVMELSDKDPRYNRIAVYAVTDGEARIGDSVRF